MQEAQQGQAGSGQENSCAECWERRELLVHCATHREALSCLALQILEVAAESGARAALRAPKLTSTALGPGQGIIP